MKTVALVGNPNCGKTTVFNRLTGANQRVGNWPGVTVERKDGRYRHGGEDVVVVDLPGVYSLAERADASLDAHVALDYLLDGEPDLIVNVVDLSNLERNLYLTTQLLELGLPLIVALTMGDLPAARRRRVDLDGLAQRLGCPVVRVDARRRRGIAALRAAISGDVVDHGAGHGPVYPSVVESALAALISRPGGESSRWRALSVLGGETPSATGSPDTVDAERRRVERALGEDIDIVLADARYGFVRALVGEVTEEVGEAGPSMTERLDRVFLNRFLGIPLFLAAMYLLFWATINVGGAFIDFFDILGGALFVDGGRAVLSAAGAPEWVKVVLADGVGGGLQTVATFIPIVGALFIFLSALEASGYMARAAFVMDRMLRLVGLPGKSFVPLMLGFGCTVPAVMATRTLESRRDRYLTILMSPFMSCGARLPVFALFAVAFFPSMGHNVVFLLYIVGMLAAVFTGLVLRWTLLRDAPTPFVMELPPYRLPTPRGLALQSWSRTKGFLLGAGRIIVVMVVALTVLGSITVSGRVVGEGDRSVIDQTSRAVTPALSPFGVSDDNWPATVGIVTGLFAKEAVVGTLNSLYGSLAGEEDGDGSFSLRAEAGAAVASVGTNLRALGDTVLDPLGTSIVDSDSIEAAAAEQEVTTGTFAAMTERFDGAAGALAYLLFILLYFPCAAAMGAIHRETTGRWAVFAAVWSTGLAYVVAVIAYQSATMDRHPASSLAWIGGTLSVLALSIALMRVLGIRHSGSGSPTAAAERPLILSSRDSPVLADRSP